MNKKLSTLLFASAFAVFSFSAIPAYAEKPSSGYAEKKMEKKCPKAEAKKKCPKAEAKKKCTKGKYKPHHNDNDRYND